MRAHALTPRSFSSALPLVLPLAAAYWFVAASLVRQWADDPNYAHGFFVLPMAAWLAWRRRDALRALPTRPDAAGFLLLGAGAFLYLAGVLAAELFTTRVSLVVVIAGLVLLLQGRARTRVLAYPLVFLLCMVPIPYVFYYRLTFPLQLLSSQLAAGFLSWTGMPLLRDGNLIHLEGYSLEVVSACSGLRSIMTLGTMALFLLDTLALKPAGTAVFLLLVIPIAVAANVARLAATAGIAAIGGPGAAESFLHELSGVVVFVTGLLAIVVCGRTIQWIENKRA